jgi:hypothetical protein
MVLSDCGIDCICRFVRVGVSVLGGVDSNRVRAFVVSDSKSLVVLAIDEVRESDSSLGGGVRLMIRRLMCWKFPCLQVWLLAFIVTELYCL